MAIAFDSIGTAAFGIGTVQSSTHTVVSNTNGILFALFATGVGATLQASPKYSGQAMTKVVIGTAATPLAIEMWYLLNPPTGLGTALGTWDVTSSRRETITIAYTGVNQTTPIAGSTAGSATAVTSGSVTRTIAANSWWVGAALWSTTSGTQAIGNLRGSSFTTGWREFGADATSGTLNWTFPSTDVAMVGAEIQPPAAGISNLNLQVRQI